MRSIAKNVACALKDNQKECSWKHPMQIIHDEERSYLFQKNQKKTPIKRPKRLLNKLKNSAEAVI